MKRKIFCVVLMIALAVFVIVSLGGCGGSGGSFPIDDGEGDKTTPSSPRYILLGNLINPRFNSSDLVPYIEARITESVDEYDLEGTIKALEHLTSRDVVFMGNSDEFFPGHEDDTDSILELFLNILTAYHNGTVFVTLYPDSEDIQAMTEMLELDVDLATPNSDDKDPHFELLAVTERFLPDGNAHTFVYVDGSDTNLGDITSNDKEEKEAVEEGSGDISSGDETVTVDSEDSEPDTTPLTPAEVEAELHTERVNNLFRWIASLDEEVKSVAADIKTASAKLQAAAGTAKDIQELVTGVTTTKTDNVSWSFIDYYNKFGKNNDNFKKFADKCDFDNERLLKKYWSDFKISRHTDTQYRVISFHSFEDHNDYYLVITRATTQPQSIVIASESGSHNHDEVAGAGAYNYAVILGNTAGLYTDVQRTYTFGGHVHYVPDQTVNKNKSYTDSNGWSMTGGIALKAGTQNNAPAADATSSFSMSVNHTSSTTWQGQDYEVIPKPNGSWLARWLLDVDYPGFADGGWKISTAAKSSVTLRTESIWASTSRNFKIKGRALWYEGFAWCHDSWILGYPKYWCAVTHSGNFVNITLPRPPRIALTDNSTDGGKEGKLYSTKLYTDENWTAKADVDWIELESTSGGQVAGVDFYYTVTPNNTGKTRTGYITIQAGKDKAVLKFVQSAY